MTLLFFLMLTFSTLQAADWREYFKSFSPEVESLKPLEACQSKSGESLRHYLKHGQGQGKKILVLSLIHGNELPAGEIAFRWIRRLEKLTPHNTWMVVPVLNPDGVSQLSRTNQMKIDLNRHFPTKNWEQEAHKYWERGGKNPHKYPGEVAGTESEVACVVKLLESFQPDLIVSLHTPFNLLDYDGPAGKKPGYLPMTWKSLGHYPGSLGRYAWAERGIPVLTIELPATLPKGLSLKMDRFQDELSYLAK